MYSLTKRIFDLAIAIPVLFLFTPVLAVIALCIRMMDQSQVLFIQKRPGLNGKPFLMVKFQTMRDFRDQDGHFLSDELRVTKLGAFLRQTSLDELPSLWNVIKGEMSLVGPRPLLMEYLPHYSSDQMRRHLVKPGLTGWAQIHGRNATTWQNRFRHDLWYIENRSIMLDLRILMHSLIQVFRFDENRPTEPMPRFSENKQL